MLKKIFIAVRDPIYLTASWTTLTKKVSELGKFVFSSLYAVYDFPRSTNPVTQEREFRWVPSFVEKGIGDIAYPTLLRKSGRVVKEPDTTFGNYSKLVHEIGKVLVEKCPRKDLSFQFEVVENSQDNAWCLPGGKIAINLGLIRNMEEEKSDYGMNHSFTLQEKIAAVLSHEITHAAARHGGRAIELRCFLLAIFKVLEYGVNFFFCQHFNNEIKELEKSEVKNEKQRQKIGELKEKRDSTSNKIFTLFDFIAYRWILTHCSLCTSRSHELEADKYGMHLVHKIGNEQNKLGFDNSSAKAAIWLQHYFKKSAPTGTGWLAQILHLASTHPSSEERLAANQKTWQELEIA